MSDLVLHTDPVEFESTNDDGDVVFVMRAIDAHCATVTIKEAITPQTWPVIAEHVQRCLDQMRLMP